MTRAITQGEAAKLIQPLVTAFPNFPFKGATADTYLERLTAYDEHELRAAVETLLRTVKWFPSLADFHHAVMEHRRDTKPASPEMSQQLPGMRECDADSDAMSFGEWWEKLKLSLPPPKASPAEKRKPLAEWARERVNRIRAAPAVYPSHGEDMEIRMRMRRLRKSFGLPEEIDPEEVFDDLEDAKDGGS